MGWNVIVGGAAVATALVTGSLSLIGFGINALVDSSLSTRTGYYLFKQGAEMTGADIKLSGTRADIDPQTNQPVVLIQFTG